MSADLEAVGVKVLLITHSRDNQSVSMVAEELKARGREPVRLDTDLYPRSIRVSAHLTGAQARRRLETPDGTLELGEVSALWYRRFAVGGSLPAELDETRTACLQQSEQALYGTIAALDCLQVDPLSAVRRADHKEVQLKMASHFGLEIPRTLISNCPDQVREFYRECRGQMIAKTLGSFAVDREGRQEVVYTSIVREEHLQQLESLSYSPMLFQELVPKRIELRATVVGSKVLTAWVDSQGSDRSSVDWRRDGVGLIDRWAEYDLPVSVAEGLRKLTGYFGLSYGAADLVVTPDGRLVFLELNSGGEWFWLQRALPIAESLADLLATARVS